MEGALGLGQLLLVSPVQQYDLNSVGFSLLITSPPKLKSCLV